jgi:hypothetical protein
MGDDLTRRLAGLVAVVRAGDDADTQRVGGDVLPSFVRWVLDDEEKSRGRPFDPTERERLERVLAGVCVTLARASAAVGAGREPPTDLLPAW